MTTLRRIVIAVVWGAGVSISAAACASSEDVQTSSTGAITDASAGGAGGSTSATGGGGGQATGSCTPSFCPAGMGEPCCVAANGPCGQDFGQGCVSQIAVDAGP